MRSKLFLALSSLLAITACSGGGSGGGDGGSGTPPIATPTPTAPTPTPSGTATPVPFPTPTPTSGDFLTRAAAMYTTQPDIAACQAGVLSATVTAQVVQTLNAVRALHRLPAVTYSPADEAGAQQSALMMAANSELSHTPPANWLCYSTAGANAAAAANLYGGYGNGLTLLTDEQVIAGWMTDVDNIIADNVGHRRWLLDPFLGSVAYGRVAGRHATNTRADAASLKVFNTSGASGPTGPLPDFVAYPYEDYPARFFDTRALLSFGVVFNKTSKFANQNVNFANAVVRVTPRGGGAALTVSKQSYDTQGYGLPNNLQFAVSGIQANTAYDVSISQVVVNGTTRSYSYYFRIVA